MNGKMVPFSSSSSEVSFTNVGLPCSALESVGVKVIDFQWCSALYSLSRRLIMSSSRNAKSAQTGP